MQFCLLVGLLAADPVCVGTGTKAGLINLDQVLVLRYGCNLIQMKQQYGHEVYVFPGFAYAKKRYISLKITKTPLGNPFQQCTINSSCSYCCSW